MARLQVLVGLTCASCAGAQHPEGRVRCPAVQAGRASEHSCHPTARAHSTGSAEPLRAPRVHVLQWQLLQGAPRRRMLPCVSLQQLRVLPTGSQALAPEAFLLVEPHCHREIETCPVRRHASSQQASHANPCQVGQAQPVAAQPGFHSCIPMQGSEPAAVRSPLWGCRYVAVAGLPSKLGSCTSYKQRLADVTSNPLEILSIPLVCEQWLARLFIPSSSLQAADLLR